MTEKEVLEYTMKVIEKMIMSKYNDVDMIFK